MTESSSDLEDVYAPDGNNPYGNSTAAYNIAYYGHAGDSRNFANDREILTLRLDRNCLNPNSLK